MLDLLIRQDGPGEVHARWQSSLRTGRETQVVIRLRGDHAISWAGDQDIFRIAIRARSQLTADSVRPE